MHYAFEMDSELYITIGDQLYENYDENFFIFKQYYFYDMRCIRSGSHIDHNVNAATHFEV